LRAPWALTKHDIEGVHHRLSETLKAPENIRTILTNTTAKSHDKVVFATQYAREALRNVNRYASQVMENMMELFDMMGHLLQYRFHPIEDIDEAFEELVLILSKREGLLPPLMSSMWKYERKNKFLKGLIKNTASYIASLVKNYLLSESVAFLISADINLHSKMKEAFQSIDPNAIKNISGTIKAIKKLKFDPIRKIISCNPFDDINEVDDDNEDDINQEFLNFLSE
jgi:DNA-directed RNA polymerase subunit F